MQVLTNRLPTRTPGRPATWISPSTRRAFTLIELLVVLGVIAILLSLILPAVMRARESARKTACSNHLKQIGLALLNYHDVHSRFPAGAMSSHQLSWHVSILPQLEQGPLFQQFSFAEGDYYSQQPNAKNNPHGLTRIEQYLCPSSSMEHSLTSLDAVDGIKSWTTHFYGIMGPGGDRLNGGKYEVLNVDGHFASQGLLTLDLCKSIADITDGTSQSFAVGELSWNDANGYRTWVRGHIKYTMSGCKNVTYPLNQQFMEAEEHFNDLSLGSEHSGGAHILFADGHIDFMSDVTSIVVLRAGASINGGESNSKF